ncbi:hypothetical protein EOS_35680 [Caballeronia mineralivorans PML1(12)]|uniref:Uncharacterized protein n=1 Tax=Caballeronia mineralivorans PML1(12) TaxID=908627 RepID=A0A0J1CM69_9BURK|nr:hypothetical protein EOS_35680 [Caballeronia mineralivorans PML1(12)]
MPLQGCCAEGFSVPQYELTVFRKSETLFRKTRSLKNILLRHEMRRLAGNVLAASNILPASEVELATLCKRYDNVSANSGKRTRTRNVLSAAPEMVTVIRWRTESAGRDWERGFE